MAKKRSAAAKVKSQDLTSNMLAAMTAGLRDEEQIAGFNVGAGLPADVCIPFPALCLRFLFQYEGLPLSRAVELAGEEGSCKSALLNEMAGWILKYDGIYAYAENENKDTRALRSALYHWDKSLISRVIDYKTTSMEEWQDFVSINLKKAKDLQTKEGGPGKTVPMVLGVDSLTSTATRKRIENTIDAGHGARGFADHALILSDYLRALPELFKGFPFLFIGTNHLKPGQDPRGLPTESVPGGKSMKFMSTFRIRTKAVKSLDKQHLQGKVIELCMRKNSVGPAGKKFLVNFVWTRVKDSEGNSIQYASWDWHTATINLLLSFKEAYIRNAIKEATGIVSQNASKCIGHSEKLGVPRDNPVSYYELSQRLEQHPEILKELYHILQISTAHMFTPGDCFDKQCAAAEQARSAVVATRYQNTALLPVLTDELFDEEQAKLVDEQVTEEDVLDEENYDL
jgi:RecA/RadA recombinase